MQEKQKASQRCEDLSINLLFPVNLLAMWHYIGNKNHFIRVSSFDSEEQDMHRSHILCKDHTFKGTDTF